MSNSQLLEKIDAAIAEKSLLKHPYRHVEAFPGHLRVLAARADETLRPVVLENLAEEVNPEGPHPQLWRDFAAALGVGEDDITSAPSLPGTQNVVHTFRDICANRSAAEAVAALYAYEAQVPEIATTKIGGLNRFYGINDDKGTAYFAVHEQADKAHREAWRNWLAENAASDGVSEDRILSTTQDALNALWGALDAVYSGACSLN